MLYKKKKWSALILLLPFIFFAGVFIVYPFIMNIIGSFYHYEFETDPTPIFVGWQNFSKLFKDKLFVTAVSNAFILIAFVIVFQMGGAILLAILVDSIRRGKQFFRVVFFMPIIISGATVGIMYFLASGGGEMGTDQALLNKILLGMHKGAFVRNGAILGNKIWFSNLFFVMVPIVWQYTGFYFVIVLTGLANISDDIMEAAALDGANGFRRTIFITLPMLQNLIRTNLVLAITGALKVYDVPMIIAPSKTSVFFMGTYLSYLVRGTDYAIGGTRTGESNLFAIFLVLVGVGVSQISNLVFRENKNI